MSPVKRAIQILFGLFLVTLPLSVRFLVYEQASYRFGQFNPWVSGFVYGPEILLLAVFGLWIIDQIQSKAEMKLEPKPLWILLGAFALEAFVITLLFGDPWLGALFILRLFEAVAIYWIITSGVVPLRFTVNCLLVAASLQIVWGGAQWLLNRDLGLYLLGESHLGPAIKNVAKLDLPSGLKQIRAYGSFLHPNILAGYLLTIFFVVWPHLKRRWAVPWLAVFGFGLYLTHSRAAWIVGIVALVAWPLFSDRKPIQFRKSASLAVGVLFLVSHLWFFTNSQAVKFADPSWAERLNLITLSQRLAASQPQGVGVSNFTLAVEQVSTIKRMPWEFQPVHNVAFLAVNETGIQGFLILMAILVLFFWKYWKQGNPMPLFVLLALGSFDHWPWDSFVGLMLWGLAIGFLATHQTKTG